MLKRLFALFRKKKLTLTPDEQQIFNNIKSRLAESAAANVPDDPEGEIFGLDPNAPFVNEYITSLEDFIINDDIGEADLKKLAALNNIDLNIARGWYPLVISMIKELDAAGWDRKVTSIKEKYARLTVYDAGPIEIIDKYERRSAKICETCGWKGHERSSGGWDFVACRKHYLDGRRVVRLNRKGFAYDEKNYRWSNVKSAVLEGDDDSHYGIELTLKTRSKNYAGMSNDVIYVSKKALGYGEFLRALPRNFEDMDYTVVDKLSAEKSYCEVCGYLAVYHGQCECCESYTWESWKIARTRDEHIIYFQLSWYDEEGEKYEALRNFYPKNPNHQILYSQQELDDYLAEMKEIRGFA